MDNTKWWAKRIAKIQGKRPSDIPAEEVEHYQKVYANNRQHIGDVLRERRKSRRKKAYKHL